MADEADQISRLRELLREARDTLQGYAGRLVGHDGQPTKNSAMAMVERIDAQMGGGAWGQELQRVREQAARYHWLCANLARIHIETTQPANSPADAPMRVTLMQVWPELPRTEVGSVDEAVAAAMKEGV